MNTKDRILNFIEFDDKGKKYTEIIRFVSTMNGVSYCSVKRALKQLHESGRIKKFNGLYSKKQTDINKLKHGNVSLEEVYEICRQSLYHEPKNDTQEGFNLALRTIMLWIRPEFTEPMAIKELKEYLKSL